MVRDAEVRVREALTQNLKDNPAIPHDVAVALAQDVDSVALPMIEVSAALTDADLLEIIQSQSGSKQTAVARRPSVSHQICEALVDTGNETAVATMVANPGAGLTEGTLNRVIERYDASDGVKAALVARPKLPIAIAERLVTLVSDHLKDEIARRHSLNSELAIDLVLAARERAVLTLSTDGAEDELEKMTRQMHMHGRLTASIVLRALCMGDLAFFEAALARLANLPVVNARKLIYDPGKRGLEAVYRRAQLPMNHLPIARAAVAIAADLHYDGESDDRERFKRRMIERMLTQYDFLGEDFDPDDIEYLLAKLNTAGSGTGPEPSES